jgi:hypothetical protein
LFIHPKGRVWIVLRRYFERNIWTQERRSKKGMEKKRF